MSVLRGLPVGRTIRMMALRLAATRNRPAPSSAPAAAGSAATTPACRCSCSPRRAPERPAAWPPTLTYLPDGDRHFVAAANAGAPASPAWYHNLVANPGVTVEVGRDVRWHRGRRRRRGAARTTRPGMPPDGAVDAHGTGDLASFYINGGFRLNLFRGNMTSACCMIHSAYDWIVPA
jgi:hypothetical protein